MFGQVGLNIFGVSEKQIDRVMFVVKVVDDSGTRAFAFAGSFSTDFAKPVGIGNDVSEQKVHADKVFEFGLSFACEKNKGTDTPFESIGAQNLSSLSYGCWGVRI